MIRRGVVSEFDEPRGLGVVTGEGGSFAFHCTAISDRTRSVAVGASVLFRIVPGHLGRLEARDLTVLCPGG